MRKKRILYVIANTMVGGVDFIMLNTIKALDRKKYHITLVVTHMTGRLKDDFQNAVDNYIQLTCTPDIKTQDDKEQLLIENTDFLRKLISTKSYDVLHIVNSWEGYSIAEEFPGNVVIGVYGYYGQHIKFFERRVDTLTRLSRKGSVSIITDTPSNLDLFPNAVIVKTGVDVRKPRDRQKRDPKQIIWIGRASGEKRVQFFLDIMDKVPDYQGVMFLVGNIRHFNFPKNVKVYHNETDRELITKELLRSSMYMNTSYIEGQPLSLIEAMHCGCVPIVPELGGMPELVGGLGTAIRLEKQRHQTRTDINNFVNAVKLYHRMMPRTMQKLRQRIRYRVKDFTIDKMTDKIIGLY